MGRAPQRTPIESGVSEPQGGPLAHIVKWPDDSLMLDGAVLKNWAWRTICAAQAEVCCAARRPVRCTAGAR